MHAMPYILCAARVLRSAVIPAPEEGSNPAILSATGRAISEEGKWGILLFIVWFWGGLRDGIGAGQIWLTRTYGSSFLAPLPKKIQLLSDGVPELPYDLG